MNDEVDSGSEENSGLIDEKKPDESTSGSRPFLVLFLAFISIVALVVSIVVFQRIGALKENAEELKTVKQRVSSIEEKLDGLARQYGELGDTVSEIGNRQELLRENLDSMYQGQKHDDIDWAMAEIEHLLIIATHELVLDGDVNTALAAMESADDRLRDITNPAVLIIRAQLTSDINSLKSVNVVDIPGMALYMADIIARVESLPLKKTYQSRLKTGSKENIDDGSGQPALWKRLLHTVWEEIKNLVVISREDESGVLSLLPDQHYYLYRNLRLQLESARLAILERDTDNLRASIELVIEWIKKYFDVEDTAISNILTSLNQMHRVKLQPDLPDISSSLETLRAFIRERTDPGPPLPQSEN